MNTKFFLIIFLVFKISLSGLPTICQKSQYSFYFLTLTWPNQFCSQNQCNQNAKNYTGSGQKQLTIHGYWPSSTNNAYFKCFSQNGYDPYCFSDFKFNQSLFTSKELTDLNSYWPKFGKMDLWSYEWHKHGTCYLYIVKQKMKSLLSRTQIVKQYFLRTVQKSKTLNIKLQQGETFKSVRDLGRRIGLHPSQFQTNCRGNNLSQIRICYNIDKDPKLQKITTCPKSTDPNLCKFPIKLL